jgi:hypothetical protein
MKIIRHTAFWIAPAALASALCGCATANSPPDANEQAQQVCTTDTTTGSQIARRTCRAPMSKEEREALDREITLHSQPAPIIKNN